MDPLQWWPAPGVWRDSLNLAIAYLLATPIGWDREREQHTAGIRTFPIVAMASCALTMLGTGAAGATPDTTSRVLQGLVTGIGFIGGGAILRDKQHVTGIATAASILSIGVTGAAVGLGSYHIAVVLSLFNFLTLRLLLPLKRELDQEPPRD